ncbi:hypothetical protein D9M69_719060 [compost metagenome]
MTDSNRGRVVSLTAVVEYPDGSSKTAELDMKGLDAIYFTEAAMDEVALQAFAAQTDWRENPTFIERRGDEVQRKCKINQCLQPY